jgi:hypothetical protein
MDHCDAAAMMEVTVFHWFTSLSGLRTAGIDRIEARSARRAMPAGRICT